MKNAWLFPIYRNSTFKINSAMLTKRIIPCLDVNEGRVVKGINYVNLRDAGDPVEQAKFYDQEMADELVFLDITASSDSRDIVLDMVHKVAEQVFIPFTVGGGIRTAEDARRMLRAGADKTEALRRAQLDLLARDPGLAHIARGQQLMTQRLAQLLRQLRCEQRVVVGDAAPLGLGAVVVPRIGAHGVVGLNLERVAQREDLLLQLGIARQPDHRPG